jgi:methyl-accepting chemotaxis protein
VNQRTRLVQAAPGSDPADRPGTFASRLPLRFHLVAGIAALLALLAASLAIAIFLVFSLRHEQSQLQERNVPYAVAVATAALNAKGIANDERGFLLSGRQEFLDELDQRLISVRTAFAEALGAADGEEQLLAVSDARAGFERWITALRTELRAYQRGDRGAALEAALGRGRALRKEYEASLARAQAVAKNSIQVRRSALGSEWSRSVTILVVGLFFALAVGLAVTFWVTRLMLKPVYDLVDVVARSAESQEAPAVLAVPAGPAEDVRRRNN